MNDNATESKPQTLNGDLHNLPADLKPFVAQDKWVLWQWERGKNKWTKVPYQPSGAKAKNNDSATWSSYAAVLKTVSRWEAGTPQRAPRPASPGAPRA